MPRLATLAANPAQGESVRAAAVADLTEHGAAKELTALLPLLRQAPPVTWALHIALLNAVTRLRLRSPDLAGLRVADNLYLQAALATL